MTETDKRTTDELNKIEFLKAASDHLKHLTTLSSGFVLIMAAFMEKLFQQPRWKVVAVVSFGAFVISILFSAIAQAYFIDYLQEPSSYRSSSDENAGITVTVSLIAWGSFLTGVISLILFAVRNFI